MDTSGEIVVRLCGSAPRPSEDAIGKIIAAVHKVYGDTMGKVETFEIRRGGLIFGHSCTDCSAQLAEVGVIFAQKAISGKDLTLHKRADGHVIAWCPRCDLMHEIVPVSPEGAVPKPIRAV